MSSSEKKIPLGFIINPIAGIGGSVGLKGSDGEDILHHARELGGIPQAGERADEFLMVMHEYVDKIRIITVPGVMGGDLSQQKGYETQLIQLTDLSNSSKLYETTAAHTMDAARKMKEEGVALLVFIGGDGTARNIVEAVGLDLPCLGIPGGVKIHSSVFATTPSSAARLVLEFLSGHAPVSEAEVLDIDESAFRQNRVISKLYGYLNVPYSPTYTQPSKMGTPVRETEQEHQASIAQWVVEEMQKAPDTYYLLGPGTTPRAISTALGEEKTLLGVDVFYGGKNIQQDLNESQLLEFLDGKKVKLYITPIGGQGFVFGRGNLQISANVLRKLGTENINIIATKYKLTTVPEGKLRIDSRDPEFDKEFIGYYRVLVNYGEFRIIDVIR